MSSPEFIAFSDAVRRKLDSMLAKGVERTMTVAIDARNELVDLYLASFPEGTNPVFRVNTTHDGTYDKNFIRRVGHVVSITDDYQTDTIWDIPDLPYPYNVVAAAMADHVRGKKLAGRFYTDEPVAGHEPNTEETESGPIDFTHFFIRMHAPFVDGRSDSLISEHRNDVLGYRNALERIPQTSVDLVLEMIEDGNLYRGDQYKGLIKAFAERLRTYKSLPGDLERDRFVFTTSPMKMRGTAIGTLMEDIGDGMDLDAAVRRYGTSVDPANYRHSKSPITRAMIEKAMVTINELGLEPALERRHAVMTDISVRDVLWADRQAQDSMSGLLRDVLLETVEERPERPGAAIAIGIKDFLRTVVPKCTLINVFFNNTLQNKLVSLIAPVHAELPPTLFAWDNNMSWTYNGNVTDSIVARVRAAGGKTDGVLRVSLAWSNTDDLDLYCRMPDGEEIYYANKSGILDVDANAPHSVKTATPVENMNFKSVEDGDYRFYVKNYQSRGGQPPGFIIEVAYGGQVRQYQSHISPAEGASMSTVTVGVRDGEVKVVQMNDPRLSGTTVSQDVWGLKTQKWPRVSSIMYSPNYWESATGQDGVHGDDEDDNRGNRHYLFMLDGCKNPEPCRGIFNEYLRPNLMPHRKVFEVIGNKTMCPPADDQLSGLGFSSTIRATFQARCVTTEGTRTYEVSV